MTQPVNPGQPYIPQASAPSAPGTYPGQPYIPPTSAASAPGVYPGQQPHPGQVPGGFPAQAPVGDSFFGNLFDTSRGFAEKYGKVIFIVAAVSFVLMWIYGAYVAGDAAAAYNFDGGREYNVGRFFIDLLLTAPYCVLQIGLVRLFIELVRGSAHRAQA